MGVFETLRGMSGGSLFMASLAVAFIGLSKAGFGGGLGMLTTPFCVLAFGPDKAIGILLPLLCAGDAFSLYHFWRKWEVKNLWFLLPGIIVGVFIGAKLFGRFSARELNIIIGWMALGFVAFQFVKGLLKRGGKPFIPNLGWGLPCGFGAGLTSTFAHGAGPVVNFFLIPQKLPKEIYVGTTVLVFTWINWIKFPFFVANKLITLESIQFSGLFLPLVPAGVWAGVWLNKRVSEAAFSKVVYALTFIAGLMLVLELNPAHYFK